MALKEKYRSSTAGARLFFLTSRASFLANELQPANFLCFVSFVCAKEMKACAASANALKPNFPDTQKITQKLAR